MNYWMWVFAGGYKRVINGWLFVQIALGAGCAWLVTDSLKSTATSILMPGMGVLVGLTFAWGANAQALLQSAEIQALARHSRGGFPQYVYTFQTAILVVLSALAMWALAGFGVFDGRWPTTARATQYFVVETMLYTLAAIALRESWQVVLGTLRLLLEWWDIKESGDADSK